VRGTTSHIHLGTKVLAEMNSLTGLSFSHTDALGSPLAKTDASGNEIAAERRTYEAYGATASGSATSGIGFTGHVNDPDTGLVYMQQRYMDPIAGRFLSVDPVTTDSNDGGGFNRYKYANNNPYRYMDPDGMQDFEVPPQIPIPLV
jgi:RHS repeat-associated protein